MSYCAVRGCGNGEHRLKQWREKFCAWHNINFGIAHCICDPPFQLFNFPTATKDPDGRKRWAKLMNRAPDPSTGKDWQPTKNNRICSRHFVDGSPTSYHPDPILNLDLPTRRIHQAVQPSFIVLSSCQPSSSSRQVIKYTSALKAAYQSQSAAPESAEAKRSVSPHVKTRVIVIQPKEEDEDAPPPAEPKVIVIQPIDEKEDLDDGLLSVKRIAATRCQRNHCQNDEVFSDAVVPDVKLENELQQTEETYRAKRCKFSNSSEHSYEELRNHFEDTKKEDDRLSEVGQQHFKTRVSEASQWAKGFVALPPASAVKSLNAESAYDVKTENIESSEASQWAKGFVALPPASAVKSFNAESAYDVKTEKIESYYEEANSEKNCYDDW